MVPSVGQSTMKGWTRLVSRIKRQDKVKVEGKIPKVLSIVLVLSLNCASFCNFCNKPLK